MSEVTQLRYRGEIADLYKIWLKNLFLQIVTLGIYRFWAKTNMRRYIWSAFSFDHESFEYTGTGGELFKGFLKAMVFFFVPVLALQMSILIWPQAAVLAFIFVPFLLVLWGMAIFGAFQYRLSRTNWRGIRGGLQGSAWAYGLRWAVGTIFIPASLLLALPFITRYRARYIIDSASFGNWQASLDPQTRACALRFYIPLLINSVVLLAIAGAIYYLVLDVYAEEYAAFLELLAGQDQRALDLAIVAVALTYVVVLSMFGMVAIIYLSAFTKEVVNHTRIGNMRLHMEFNFWDYFKYTVLYSLLQGLSLGLVGPLVLHWRCRLLAERLSVRGRGDLSSLLQSQVEKPTSGEGLLEAMDVDLAF